MPDPKDTSGFFKKVAKFVANPATHWSELDSKSDTKRSEFLKSELRAMVERKRRNDFVRKREFDMLRKIRREGISDGLALARSSALDDTDGGRNDNKDGLGVKNKIDEIEQEMSAELGVLRRHVPSYAAATTPMKLHETARQGLTVDVPPAINAAPPALRPATAGPGTAVPPMPAPTPIAAKRAPGPATVRAALEFGSFGNNSATAVEVMDIALDPELDEAVIAFANADFDACEAAVLQVIGPAGVRTNHAETWLALFDLYRAIGQQDKFDSLAIDYAQRFGSSAPQWYSLPKLVAAQSSFGADAAPRAPANVGWSCPEHLDLDAVAKLRSLLLQLPLPWVLDWSAFRTLDPDAATGLRELFRSWTEQSLEMRWRGSSALFNMLQEYTQTGERDTDPAYWMLRLEALRLANKAAAYDEVAIDYCVTYEVSPPAWAPAKSSVRLSEGGGSTAAAALSRISEVSTMWVDSQIMDEPGQLEVASVDLSGQLVGDISKTLEGLTARLGEASIVNVSCSALIRVDFIAAGDLLNWVLARKAENRAIHFQEANRLVALFFGAMGINEHAKITVRNV